MKKRLLRITKELLARPTAPFREELVRAHIRDFCQQRGIHIRQDDMGNLLVTYGDRYRNPVLAFAAHMDHPGFIVERDSRGGRTTARFYGVVEKDYFLGTPIRVFASAGEVTGRITAVQFDPGKRIPRMRLRVNGKVRRGDPAMWDLIPVRVQGDRLHSRACDDQVGCAAVLGLLDELCRRDVKRQVLAVFTVAEEAGLHGATYMCMRRFLPRSAYVLAVETSRELPAARIGDGVVIRVGDRTSVFTPQMTAFMMHAARLTAVRDASFKYQRKLMDGGCASRASIRRSGMPTERFVCLLATTITGISGRRRFGRGICFGKRSGEHDETLPEHG